MPGYYRPPGEGPGALKLHYIAETPAFSGRRRQSALQIAITDEKCNELKEAGLIEPAPTSKFASSPVIAAKKAPDGTWSDHRFCVSYVAQNNNCEPLHTNVPVADVLFQRLGKAKWFSKLDMRAGYLQLPVDPASRDITAFWWNNSLWRYTRTPFGLRNAPAAFQGIMDYELRRAGLEDTVVCFIADVLVFTETWEEHVKVLDRVFEMLRQCGLRAHPEKSQFGTDTIDFLGFEVSNFGLTPQDARVKSLIDMPPPTRMEELRTGLGKLRYYGT